MVKRRGSLYRRSRAPAGLESVQGQAFILVVAATGSTDSDAEASQQIAGNSYNRWPLSAVLDQVSSCITGGLRSAHREVQTGDVFFADADFEHSVHSRGAPPVLASEHKGSHSLLAAPPDYNDSITKELESMETVLTSEQVRSVLEQQPFTGLLEAYLHSIDGRAVDLRLEIRPQLRQQQGFVHGGVLSYLADNALTIAGGLVLGPMVVTGEYKINYVRPAEAGTLSARAYSISHGKTQAVCCCEIFEIDLKGEKIVAIAQGTICVLTGARGA